MKKDDKKEEKINNLAIKHDNDDIHSYNGPQTFHMFVKEWITPNYGIFSDIENIHWISQSKYQDIRVVESKQFGKTLILDYHTQSSEFDEHLYHESLIHPAMIAHDKPKKKYL